MRVNVMQCRFVFVALINLAYSVFVLAIIKKFYMSRE